MSRSNLAWLVVLLAFGLVGLSMFMTLPTPASTLQEKHENYKLVVDILEEIQQKYAKELKPEDVRKLIENMVNGGLRDFDQHSYFYNKQDYREFKTQSTGRFIGVGIQIGLNKYEQLYVISPVIGSPAYEAGILAGDRIVGIDGAKTEKMDIEEAKRRIIGEPGTQVKLTVQHNGSKTSEDKMITRREIHIESVMGDRRDPVNLKEWDFMIDPKLRIGYIRINSFSETTAADMVKVVESLQKLGMKGLVLDLRGNPGGLLKAAVEVSSLFLPDGKTVVSTKGRTKAEDHSYKSSPPVPGFTPQTDYPIAILINRGSASAAEILAAALQDYFRAIIVGERSYGKGSVQNMIPMENGESALKITTALYFPPGREEDGKRKPRNINRESPVWNKDDKKEWGVHPDPGYEVNLTDDQFRDWLIWRRERDIVHDKGKEPEAKDAKKTEVKDVVLEKALDYIRSELGKRGAAGAIRPAAVAERPAPILLPTLTIASRR
ncbi:MAG: S41 family peptidase [Gemmataceae bacterium]